MHRVNTYVIVNFGTTLTKRFWGVGTPWGYDFKSGLSGAQENTKLQLLVRHLLKSAKPLRLDSVRKK